MPDLQFIINGYSQMIQNRSFPNQNEYNQRFIFYLTYTQKWEKSKIVRRALGGERVILSKKIITNLVLIQTKFWSLISGKGEGGGALGVSPKIPPFSASQRETANLVKGEGRNKLDPMIFYHGFFDLPSHRKN